MKAKHNNEKEIKTEECCPPLAVAFLPFITPNLAFNLCGKNDFCLPDEETMQRTMGAENEGGWLDG